VNLRMDHLKNFVHRSSHSLPPGGGSGAPTPDSERYKSLPGTSTGRKVVGSPRGDSKNRSPLGETSIEGGIASAVLPRNEYNLVDYFRRRIPRFPRR
jgi:hypothetical protein